MADYASLLRDHVTLTCRCVDRFFLQGYVPKLQSVGQVCKFLRWQRGYKIPSSAVTVHLLGDGGIHGSPAKSWVRASMAEMPFLRVVDR